jgi:NAD(P)-dependent dehydrogenase (short-subunit alcohol dehydrogenase family)
MGKLDGKNVIITGAAGGQGQAACRLFCQEGGRVLGTDLDEQSGARLAEELRGKGYDFSYVTADLSGSAGCERLADQVRARFDRVDVLYNNHGIILGKPLLETTEQEWDRVHDVDLKSVFLLVRQIAPLMRDRGGSIINVSSVGGLVAFSNMAAYGAAKGGLAMFSKAAAADLAPYGIRVNAICPGVVDTQMPRNFVSGLEAKDDIWKGFEEGHLVGRLGRAEEIVPLALYLASDDSTFMTGAVIPIDGGWSVQ